MNRDPALSLPSAAAAASAAASAATPLPLPRQLRRGACLTLRSAGGLQVQVQAGRVWITAAGAPGDHFVAAGERFRFDAGARDVVVESDGREHATLLWRTLPRAGGGA